nr:MAG TPA: hypothetical protein [Caudoviricetes sp.]
MFFGHPIFHHHLSNNQKKPHDVRPFQDLSLRIKIAIGTTGFEPVTS